ncbi:MAG: signal peptidase I [Patescibacteria group bacterium]
MKNTLTFLLEVGKIVLIALLLVWGLRTFVFQPFLVRGASMEPNFHNWDYLIVDQISYRFRPPQRGEVVVFKYPHNPSQRYIKRIVGLPGETITVNDGKVTILKDDHELVLGESSYLLESHTPGSLRVALQENEYFVLGDNRVHSSDSRVWGVLPKDFIIGQVWIRVFPLSAFAKVEAPNY